MNHLAHFVLAPIDDQARAGTWLGDFVRGSDLSAWPCAIEQAIRLHRRVDSFTDTHTITQDARRRVPAPQRRYAGILLDVYFDHILMRHWPRWHAMPLKDYGDSVHACLARIAPGLPEPAGRIARGMATNEGLTACASVAGMAHVLARIGKRLSRPVALDLALPALIDAHTALESAFEAFFPLLKAEAARYLATSSRNTLPPELSVSR